MNKLNFSTRYRYEFRKREKWKQYPAAKQVEIGDLLGGREHAVLEELGIPNFRGNWRYIAQDIKISGEILWEYLDPWEIPARTSGIHEGIARKISGGIPTGISEEIGNTGEIHKGIVRRRPPETPWELSGEISSGIARHIPFQSVVETSKLFSKLIFVVRWEYFNHFQIISNFFNSFWKSKIFSDISDEIPGEMVREESLEDPWKNLRKNI